MKEQITKLKVEDYGDMLAKVKGMEFVAYQQYGTYQGEYLVVLRDKGNLYFYMDSYGSCSGCDWLEAERDSSANEVLYKDALDYCNQVSLKAQLPEVVWKSLTDEQKQRFVPEDCYEKEDMAKQLLQLP